MFKKEGIFTIIMLVVVIVLTTLVSGCSDYPMGKKVKLCEGIDFMQYNDDVGIYFFASPIHGNFFRQSTINCGIKLDERGEGVYESVDTLVGMQAIEAMEDIDNTIPDKNSLVTLAIKVSNIHGGWDKNREEINSRVIHMNAANKQYLTFNEFLWWWGSRPKSRFNKETREADWMSKFKTKYQPIIDASGITLPTIDPKG